MSQEFTVRRSVPGDGKALTPLIDRIGEILVSRYGRKDLNQLLEESIFCLTVLENDEPVAVACFSFPPDKVFFPYRQLLLNFFASETQIAGEAGRLIFRTAFESQPCIDMIVTELSETSPLESCLVPLFSLEDGQYAKCPRETVLPPLTIRGARVEDYDDLMPLFEAEAPDLIQQYGKFFVSDLIKSENTKCLVAEGKDGLAVGFLGIEPDFDASPHKDSYDLSGFQDLFEEEHIAFRIRIFFMADEYRLHARDFMKPMFALMRGSDYCLMFLPTDSPPFALAQFFTRIPSLDHGKERFVLYLCHVDSVGDVTLAVRQFTAEDYSLFENFVEPLANRLTYLEACNDHPDRVYLLLVNGIIAGAAIFDEQGSIDYHEWDLEEYVDIKACSKYCKMIDVSISPIFQRFMSFFLVRCMEGLDVHGIYVMHTTGKLNDMIGSLFLAIERRQGPVGKELEVHFPWKESMHLLARKFALQPKLEINTSIVVVGSTEAVAAFVYRLISVPYLHFSSIHVVCTGGSERVWVNTATCREYPPDWLQHLHLLNAVHFFEAELAEIERDEDQIILDDGTVVSYDFLILMTAKQGEIADMWMAKNFVENTKPPVSVIGGSPVAFYILSFYSGAAHIAQNPRFKIPGTKVAIIQDSTVANCDFKEVSPTLLGILERSSLVYDGGIVIDELFRTNDTKIFATGPLTIFSRLYRVKPEEEIISQVEYGNQIGQVILKFVDPLEKFEEPSAIVGSVDDKALAKTKGPESIPKFSTRRTEWYQLQGGRIFYRNGFPCAGRCLETTKGGHVIRLFVNSAGFIQAFEYEGLSDGSIFNWNKLIGLPAVLLNNMIERYDKKMISDFAAFFNEPWCAAVMHDRFRKFFDMLHAEIVEEKDLDSPEVGTKIRQAVLDFLIDNSDLLPDYFTSESQIPPLPDSDDESPPVGGPSSSSQTSEMIQLEETPEET